MESESVVSDAEDPHFGFYDEFEEQMDRFFKDEKPLSIIEEGDISDYFDDEEEGDLGGLEGLDVVDEEEISRILAEEEESLMQENGLEELQKGTEKITLDRLNVEKLINMLSKVRLTWPEDMPWYNENEFATDPERAKFRESFYHLTDKEKTVMWHAENFRRQFQNQFPKRRALLIAMRNECGSQRLFPTFINPCILGYPEFLDWFTCTKFFKDFLAPQMMEQPPRVPDRIRSHYTALKNRKVNCYEFAVILATFLIGAGYDAYVVDGYASKSICTMDSTEDYIEPSEEPEKIIRTSAKKDAENEAQDTTINFEFLDLLMQEKEEAVRPVSPSKYRFKRAAEIVSQYATEAQKPENEAEDQQSLQAEQSDMEEEQEEEETQDETEEETEIKPKKIFTKPSDKYYAMRTHAWVLVLAGKREIESSFFIEPFSALKYELGDENFHGIETVFNQKNFYVNIQQNPDGYGIEDLSYDLNDPSKWSKLLVEAEKKKKTKEEEASLFQDEEDDAEQMQAELLLDMPVSWTPDPDIPQEDYERRYPGGNKTFNYNNAIVELAAPYVNDDGMVKKVLKFTGRGRDPDDLIYIEEIFENRNDKLIKRKFFRNGRLLHEYFDKGRRDALKEHVHISGKNKPSYPRDLYYYSNAHPQCVSHRQIVRKGIIEHFEGRDDLLYYRSTMYGAVLCDIITKTKSDPEVEDKNKSKSKAREFLEMLKGDNSGAAGKKRIRRKITKIVEKYHQGETKSKDMEQDTDIAEKDMVIDEGRLRILFHYGYGNLTRNSLEFFKPKGCNPDTTDFIPEDCIEYQADPQAPMIDVYRKFKLLQRMEKDQRAASVLAAQAEDEVFQAVTSRIQEDWRHEIEPDAFAGDRNEEYIKMKEQKVVEDEDETEEDLTGIDFTTPFFEKFGVPRNKQEEVLMKKRIMLNAKVKLVKKAHSIRESYEREASHLSENMKWHDLHIEKMTPDQEEDFGHMYKERLFEMHIMEKRLTRHQELASKKYYNTLLDVLKHPQLNKYSNKKIPPVRPVIIEITEEEKLRLASELAKKEDCCQFYSVKYTEPKKDDKKDKGHTKDATSVPQEAVGEQKTEETKIPEQAVENPQPKSKPTQPIRVK